MKKTAVALRYSPELPAPFVLAKGRQLRAEQIIRLAQEHGVPVEQSDASESLYFVDPGEMIPEHLYGVVAELLVFVATVRERSGNR